MTQTIHPLDVILHKRNGHVLTDAEIQAFIHALVQRTPQKQLVTDAQIAAFLMAVFLRGLDPRELATLTAAMRFSGEVAYTEALNSGTRTTRGTSGSARATPPVGSFALAFRTQTSGATSRFGP